MLCILVIQFYVFDVDQIFLFQINGRASISCQRLGVYRYECLIDKIQSFFCYAINVELNNRYL